MEAMRRQWISILLVIGFVFSLSLVLAAQGAELKQRFIKRTPAINGMKARGVVGENNTGNLVVRGQVSAQERRIVNEENVDRRTIYTQIAKRNGTPVEIVGKQRAVKIARNAPPGHWLQSPEGKWYRK